MQIDLGASLNRTCVRQPACDSCLCIRTTASQCCLLLLNAKVCESSSSSSALDSLSLELQLLLPFASVCTLSLAFALDETVAQPKQHRRLCADAQAQRKPRRKQLAYACKFDQQPAFCFCFVFFCSCSWPYGRLALASLAPQRSLFIFRIRSHSRHANR